MKEIGVVNSLSLPELSDIENFYTIKPSGEAEQWRVGMSRNFDSKVGFFNPTCQNMLI